MDSHGLLYQYRYLLVHVWGQQLTNKMTAINRHLCTLVLGGYRTVLNSAVGIRALAGQSPVTSCSVAAIWSSSGVDRKR
jgi:hypothetical protein